METLLDRDLATKKGSTLDRLIDTLATATDGLPLHVKRRMCGDLQPSSR